MISLSLSDILHIHKGALNKKKEHKKLCEDGKVDSNVLESVGMRADVVTYATLAEMNHFQTERVTDFKNMMQSFLTAQINFYQNIVYQLQETLTMYEHA